MLKLGIIGTGWITQQFVQAAELTRKYQLVSVYSRTLLKAEMFAKDFNVTHLHDNLEKFLNPLEIDVLYIASPNAIHFEQAQSALKAGISVIVEKPAFTTPEQYEIIQLLAQEKGLVFVEAARHVHDPNFVIIRNEVQKFDVIQGATLQFLQYSSRYDQVLDGKEPNIFSLKFAGGALADIGVYLVYDAIGWFGMPDKVSYRAQKLWTGVDGMGVATLSYPEFDVTLIISKITQSEVPSEIYGLRENLTVNKASIFSQIEYSNQAGDRRDLVVETPENPMLDEANDFADLILNFDDKQQQERYQAWQLLAKQVNQVMYDLRQSAEIIFPTDN